MLSLAALTLNEYNLPYPPPLEGPIHPIVVHFVIAMVVFSVVFDIIGSLTRRRSLLNLGWWNLVVATAAILVAILFGQLEAGLANVSDQAQAVLNQHTIIGWALSVVLVALALWRGIQRNRDPLKLSVPYLGAGVLVVSLVFYQVLLGTQLAWIHGLHVKPAVQAQLKGGNTP